MKLKWNVSLKGIRFCVTKVLNDPNRGADKQKIICNSKSLKKLKSFKVFKNK